MLLPTPCPVDNPSARRPCDLNPTPRRAGAGQTAPVRTHAPDRTGPDRAGPPRLASPRAAPRTPPSLLRPSPSSPGKHLDCIRTTHHPLRAPRDPAPPRPDLRRRRRRLRRAPSRAPGASAGAPQAAAPRLVGSPAPNPNPSSRRGALQVRPLLHRALRPVSLWPPRPLGVAIEACRVSCGGVGGRSETLSGLCRETAPAAAELCCIWAGRAWGGTCAGPLHAAVAVPGLTGNVHGLKVRYVHFSVWEMVWACSKM
ncbi:hypothetical protein PVAP13_5KG294400 [Panicum virgatum]|uniref:Uncharacterized protein n=1 Tax=Panicum virgatum TaxID=38727 RepID=A0A8T0SJ62_PANVG|nr:hypothetical protein PVAP13_5KG294400 [Panicum virgatum]